MILYYRVSNKRAVCVYVNESVFLQTCPTCLSSFGKMASTKQTMVQILSLQPNEVQGHAVPDFKALICLYLEFA